ncbi:hypothetical protein PV08_03699 [Exophiala spinifera]|uniref:Uncharacterized protein n=1 Tax=Exophiala spinifera TaxID=91928 RepID=A0A0D2C767_9EURO|nr:uncharacterized protein PV08_03699 [Exophiala spinifera]KIW19404.1 hypothetical protein PV08_03699 [Exophiala spinifera]
MELGFSGFKALNVGSNFEQSEDVNEYFTLHAPPNSNIQRGPASPDDVTAPMVLKRLQQSFLLAEVTVSAEFAMDHDQAGLVIFAGAPPDELISQAPASRRSSRYSVFNPEALVTRRWAKAGLEFARGELHAASSVAISTCGADWSSSARMPSPFSTFDPFSLTSASSQSLRIRFERVDQSLWISYEIPNYTEPETTYYAVASEQQQNPEELGSRWKQMREVAGFFAGVEQKGNIWVGCYASRPMDYEPSNAWDEVDELIAEFEDLDIL